MNPLQAKIVAKAKAYVGTREKPGNAGWLDAEFEAKMKAVGWQKSWAWCALFAELAWTEAFRELAPDRLPAVARLFSPMATGTFGNATKAGFKTSKAPVPGAVAIWKHGTGPTGHAGIVTAVSGDIFESVEGNTNALGGREGDEVAVKTRRIDFTVKPGRLNLVGFILPE